MSDYKSAEMSLDRIEYSSVYVLVIILPSNACNSCGFPERRLVGSVMNALPSGWKPYEAPQSAARRVGLVYTSRVVTDIQFHATFISFVRLDHI